MSNAMQTEMFATVIAPVPARSEIKAWYGWIRDNGIDRSSSFSNGDMYEKNGFRVMSDDVGYVMTTWQNGGKVDGVWVEGRSVAVAHFETEESALLELAKR